MSRASKTTPGSGAEAAHEAAEISLGRAELVALIAVSIRRHATYVGEAQAKAMADTILRDLCAAGFTGMSRKRVP